MSRQFTRDFLLEVKKGKIAGHSLVHLLGENTSVSTSFETLWGIGGLYPFPTAAATIEAISTDANDTSGGTGARTIHVYGLDTNFEEIDEVITMNGTTATTATTQSFRRINLVIVEGIGVYGGSNIGDITIRVSGAGANLSYIEVGEGQSNIAVYTIPLGKTGYMLDASITMDSNKEIEVHILKREDADDTTAPMSPVVHIHHWVGITNPIINDTFTANHVLPEKTDLWFNGLKTTAGTAHIDTESNLILVDN